MPDRLSPENLAQVPEVRRALTLYCSNGASSPAQGVSREEFEWSERVLLAAIRDAVLAALIPGTVEGIAIPTTEGLDRWTAAIAEKHDLTVLPIREAQHKATLAAHREAVLALTPEQVVEAAAKAMWEKARIDFPEVAPMDWDALSEAHKSYYRTLVRAALPILLGPERARREAVERERDEIVARDLRLFAIANERTDTLMAELRMAKDDANLRNATLDRERLEAYKILTRAEAAEAERDELRKAIAAETGDLILGYIDDIRELKVGFAAERKYFLDALEGVDIVREEDDEGPDNFWIGGEGPFSLLDALRQLAGPSEEEVDLRSERDQLRKAVEKARQEEREKMRDLLAAVAEFQRTHAALNRVEQVALANTRRPS